MGVHREKLKIRKRDFFFCVCKERQTDNCEKMVHIVGGQVKQVEQNDQTKKQLYTGKGKVIM